MARPRKATSGKVGEKREATRTQRTPLLRRASTLVIEHGFVLQILRGPGSGTYLELGEGNVFAGRDEDADLMLDDPSASRLHFEVRPTAQGYVLRDLESTNGTEINRIPVVECRLSDGDVITVGGTDIGFLPKSKVKQPEQQA